MIPVIAIAIYEYDSKLIDDESMQRQQNEIIARKYRDEINTSTHTPYKYAMSERSHPTCEVISERPRSYNMREQLG